jgi:hypothetical protein
MSLTSYHSHIKGKPSHKIVSDGKCLFTFSPLSEPQLV